MGENLPYFSYIWKDFVSFSYKIMTINSKNLDDRNNVIRFSVPNRTIKFYSIKREEIEKQSFDFLKTSGVYILFNNRFNEIVYIGESDRPEGMQARIKEHIKKEKQFDWVLFVVSSDMTQPLSSIRFKLEYSLINDYKPDINSSLGKPSRLSDDDYELYKEVYVMIKEFLERQYHIIPEIPKEDKERPENKIMLIKDLGYNIGDYVYFLRYYNKYYNCYSKDLNSPGAYGKYIYRAKIESDYLIGDVEYYSPESDSYVGSDRFSSVYTIDNLTELIYEKEMINGFKFWGNPDGTTLSQL